MNQRLRLVGVRTTEELAFEVVIQNLERASRADRVAAVKRVAAKYFPATSQHRLYQNMWPTRDKVTQVGLWGDENLKNNLMVAMFKEKLGLGPNHYQIVRTMAKRFEKKLFCITRLLPWEKFCLMPSANLPLGGPFLRSEAGRRIAIAIYEKRISYTQQSKVCERCH